MPDIFVFEALHSPLTPGVSRGALYEVQPLQLIVQLLRQLGFPEADPTAHLRGVHLATTHPIFGQGGNLARISLLNAGLPDQTWGHCLYGAEEAGWSALAAAVAGLQQSPGSNLGIAGGVDSFSRLSGYLPENPWYFDLRQLRAGRVLPAPLVADLLATRFHYGRDRLDDWAGASVQRATSPSGRKINRQRLVPVCDPNGLPIAEDHQLPPERTEADLRTSAPPVLGDNDLQGLDTLARGHFPELEFIRHDHTRFTLAEPADAAAILLLGTAEAGQKKPWRPVARMLALAEVGGPIEDPYLGSVLAAKEALRQAGLKGPKIDTWACLEPCAAAALRFGEALDLPDGKLNESGGELALGLSGGAAAGVLISRLLSTMEVQKRTLGLAALSSPSGQGGACILEWIS